MPRCRGLRRRAGLLSLTVGADYGLTERIFSLARDAVTEAGGRLIVVYLPAYASLTKDSAVGTASIDDVYRTIMRQLAALDIQHVDVRAALAQHPDPKSLFPFGRSNHFNELGHELVARAVLEALAGSPQ